MTSLTPPSSSLGNDIDLTTEATGVLPVANGGTNSTSEATFKAAFNLEEGTDYSPPVVVQAFSSGPNNIVAGNNGEYWVNTTGSNTYNLPAISTLTAGWYIDLKSISGTATVDTPSDSATIKSTAGSAASMTISSTSGSSCSRFVFDGTDFQASGPVGVSSTSFTGVVTTASGAQAIAGTSGVVITGSTLAAALMNKGSDIASAGTITIPAVGNYHDVTGTTTITSFGSPAVATGWEITLKFEGTITITHNATSLILPGGANIIALDGDVAKFRYEGSGNWRCVTYQRAALAP